MKALSLLIVALLMLVTQAVYAQTCNYTPAQISSENVTIASGNECVDGDSNQGLAAEVVLIVQEGATFTMNGDLQIYDRVEVYGILTVNGDVTAEPILGESTVYVGENGTFNVNGNYTNGGEDWFIFSGAPGTTDVDGNMNVSGTYTNNDGGTTTVSDTGTLQSGTFDDQGGTVTIDGVADPEDCEDGCCGGGCLALPVVMVELEAKETNSSALISWTTAQEIDNDYFEVYKLTDETDQFVVIGIIDGQGTTKVKTTYQFIDKDFDSDAYYQIRQVDFDGQSETFGPIALSKETSVPLNLEIYPNPSSGPIQLSGSGYTGFSIHNMRGQLIRMEPNRMGEEAEEIINSALLSSKGTFFLTFWNGEEKVVKRIIKR